MPALDCESPLLTDLYEFTMLQAYFDSGMNDIASFEFFVRKLPPGRNFLLDAPYLDCAYKLTEYAGLPRRKRSEGKATWPGRKQSYRRYGADGTMLGDTLTIEGDTCDGLPLMRPCMTRGRRVAPEVPLLTSRAAYAAQQLAALPAALRALEQSAP